VFAVLADGALVSFRTDGTPVSASPPAELPPDAVPASGHDLAVSKDGNRVYALVRGAGSVPDRIIVADRSSGAILATYLLADVGGYGAVTVGPTSGHIYLFGNRNGGVLLSEVDPYSGMLLASWMLRGSDGLDWLVYQGAVVTDEQRVYVSYHGTTTTGIDWFDRDGDKFQACAPRLRRNTGCALSHGGFGLEPDRLLAATGTPIILLFNQDGLLERAFDTRLSGNHLMEFALAPDHATLYAVGVCGYVGGYSSLSLQDGGVLSNSWTSGSWTWVATPGPAATNSHPAICANRLALGGGLIALAQARVAVPQMDRAGGIGP
jgi:hypothetical protein